MLVDIEFTDTMMQYCSQAIIYDDTILSIVEGNLKKAYKVFIRFYLFAIFLCSSRFIKTST